MATTAHSLGSLDVSTALDLYRTMTRIRAFERQAQASHKAGDVPGVVHLSIGQEAIAAGVCAHLARTDYVTSTHRGHGHCLAKGSDPGGMMAEIFGRETGTCKGKGGSMHIADFSVGMLGAQGIVGGSIGIAVGAAQAAQLRGEQRISVCFFGDGAVNRGPFLEGLNWASIFKLPVVFVCEDNTFAAYSRTDVLTGGPGAAARAEAIGVPAVKVDGNDVIAVYETAAATIETARGGGGPRFIHAPTFRLEGHTVFDGTVHHNPDELARAQERDPIARFALRLLEAGASSDQLAKLEAEATAEMERAAAAAHDAPWPKPHEALEDVQDIGAPQ